MTTLAGTGKGTKASMQRLIHMHAHFTSPPLHPQGELEVTTLAGTGKGAKAALQRLILMHAHAPSPPLHPQGELEVTTLAGTGKGTKAAASGSDVTEAVPFLLLGIELPPAPLFKDVLEKNIIPQVRVGACVLVPCVLQVGVEECAQCRWRTCWKRALSRR